MTASLFFVAAALGAVVLFLMTEPRPAPFRAALTVCGLGAMALMISAVARNAPEPGDASQGGPFWVHVLLALVAVAGAARMVTHPRPVYAALYFILVILAVAVNFLLLQAEFMAFALLIVYAGAILITYLFVLMLAQQSGDQANRGEEAAWYDRTPREPAVALVLAFVEREFDCHKQAEVRPGLEQLRADALELAPRACDVPALEMLEPEQRQRAQADRGAIGGGEARLERELRKSLRAFRQVSRVRGDLCAREPNEQRPWMVVAESSPHVGGRVFETGAGLRAAPHAQPDVRRHACAIERHGVLGTERSDEDRTCFVEIRKRLIQLAHRAAQAAEHGELLRVARASLAPSAPRELGALLLQGATRAPVRQRHRREHELDGAIALDVPVAARRTHSRELQRCPAVLWSVALHLAEKCEGVEHRHP